jgi:hypothetical protein
VLIAVTSLALNIEPTHAVGFVRKSVLT